MSRKLHFVIGTVTEMNTREFIALITISPESLRGVSKIRIINPYSMDRVFILVPDHMPQIRFSTLDSSEYCDIRSISFARDSLVARLKVYGTMPFDLAAFILRNAKRKEMFFNGSPLTTFVFVNDGPLESETDEIYAPSNYIMGANGDVLLIKQAGDGYAVKSIQITPIGASHYHISARAVVNGQGSIFVLKDGPSPLQDLDELKPDAWVNARFSLDSHVDIRKLITIQTSDGPMALIATDKGILVTVDDRHSIIPETMDRGIQSMAVDWSSLALNKGRFVFRAKIGGHDGFYSWDFVTRKVKPVVFTNGFSKADLSRYRVAAVSSNRIYLIDENHRTVLAETAPAYL